MRARKRPTARTIPPRHWPLLLTVEEAALYLGLSVSKLFVARAEDDHFPKPVAVPGRTLPMYRKDDLRDYVATLTPVGVAGAVA